MHTEGTVPDPLTEDELKELVREAIDNAEDTDNPESYHALYAHLERGLQTDDVIHGLERDWHFQRSPRFNRDEWQWKYYILTESIDGDAITIVIAVDSLRREFEVITRWVQQH